MWVPCLDGLKGVNVDKYSLLTIVQVRDEKSKLIDLWRLCVDSASYPIYEHTHRPIVQGELTRLIKLLNGGKDLMR